MKIIVKSNAENFNKEMTGIKPNTVRKLDGKDIIQVIETEHGYSFEREITDITVFDGRIIISWKGTSGRDKTKVKKK